MRYCTVLLILIACAACSEIEVNASLSRDQFTRLISNDADKSWEVVSNGSGDFESCTDGLIYIFSIGDLDTGSLQITLPAELCDGGINLERDTLSSLRWTFSNTESALFDNRIFLLDGSQATELEVSGLTPENINLRNPQSGESLRLEEVSN